MFVIWNETVVTLTGTRWKHVTCDYCRGVFHYPVTETVRGAAQTVFWLFLAATKRAAERNARKRLDRALNRRIDPCPCPSCGCYQPNVFRQLAQGFYGWMAAAAAACIPLWFGCLCVSAYLCRPAAQATTVRGFQMQQNSTYSTGLLITLFWFLVGTALLVGCMIRRWRFDPNSAIPLAVRLERGEELALTDDQYQDQVQQGMIPDDDTYHP